MVKTTGRHHCGSCNKLLMTPSVSLSGEVIPKFMSISTLDGCTIKLVFFSFLQTTLPPYWRNEVASGDGTRPCIDCRCWLQTTENPPSAAQTRFRCAYVTVTRMAWPCLVELWPTRQLALALAPFWLFWAASLHFWVRTGWPQCQKHKTLFQLFVFSLGCSIQCKGRSGQL